MERPSPNPEDFDLAAQQAADELARLDQGTVKAVADWWAKWYIKAGHKRLGRLLVQISKGG